MGNGEQLERGIGLTLRPRPGTLLLLRQLRGQHAEEPQRRRTHRQQRLAAHAAAEHVQRVCRQSLMAPGRPAPAVAQSHRVVPQKCKSPKHAIHLGLHTGGVGGIRTLDAGFAHILP